MSSNLPIQHVTQTNLMQVVSRISEKHCLAILQLANSRRVGCVLCVRDGLIFDFCYSSFQSAALGPVASASSENFLQKCKFQPLSRLTESETRDGAPKSFLTNLLGDSDALLNLRTTSQTIPSSLMTFWCSFSLEFFSHPPNTSLGRKHALCLYINKRENARYLKIQALDGNPSSCQLLGLKPCINRFTLLRCPHQTLEIKWIRPATLWSEV